MRAAIRGSRAGASASAMYALAGYVGMLALGRLVIPAVNGGDSFADLGLAALTLVVFAPLAGLAGAIAGFIPYRHQRLRSDAATFWSAAFVVVVFSATTAGVLDLPTAVSTSLIGLAALLVMRVALLERQARRRVSS